jgi:myo-inositol-1(or 4)-monophosphatase
MCDNSRDVSRGCVIRPGFFISGSEAAVQPVLRITMMTRDLYAVRAAAEAIARETGALLLTYANRPHRETVKGVFTDIVTEADPAAEALITARLTALFPDDHIIGEEGGGMGAPADRAAYFWHVDPLDGTVNFANDIPYYAVSLGMSGRDGVPLVGVVYDPTRDELFSAARGLGAALNGTPLRVTATAQLSSAILCSGFPYDVATRADNNLVEWTALLGLTRGLRRFGSAALDLCYVAAGRFDGYWEKGIHSWDCAAGLVIIEEAGGRVSDYGGGVSSLLYSGGQIVATNGLIHDALVAALQTARQSFQPQSQAAQSAR